MKVNEILENYSEAALDQISKDKLEESINLRLPRSIIIKEISEALSSHAYIAGALAPSRPPTYAFLKLLLSSENYTKQIEGYKEEVLNATKEMTKRAKTGKGLTPGKNYKLYLKILKTAWENDGKIDRSEASLLESLRNELNISNREHLLLEHHPDVREFWETSNSYIAARNHILSTGIVLTHNNCYVLSEEVALKIRRHWGIELKDNSYERLLRLVTHQQLSNILEMAGLRVSGSKEEKISRIIKALVSPIEILDYLNIDELRELCRNNEMQISGNKDKVIENIIYHFDNNLDLTEEQEIESEKQLPDPPEKRQLSNDILEQLLQHLTNDQLHDVLACCYLKTSGSKNEKVERLIKSPWSEKSMISSLRGIDLSSLCWKIGIKTSGVKSELIDRILSGASTRFSRATAAAINEDNESQKESKVCGKIKEKKEDALEVGDIEDPYQKEITSKSLKEIEKEFPFLEKDEKTIVALIKDTRSLTEQEIKRASKRHGFGWFLTKAHMSDIMRKLIENGNNPIHIRGVKSINIYDWAPEQDKTIKVSKKKAARDIIDALRQGVVPANNLNLLLVGQEMTLKHLMELIKEIHKENSSAFKFVKGPYGAGKTFLCTYLRELALINEFVVANVNIGPDQPLSDLPVFFSGLINGMRTPDKLDSCALADVLESWLFLLQKKTAQIEGLDAFDPETKKKLTPIVEQRIETEMENLSNYDPGFAPAMRAFYKARNTDDHITAAMAVAWITGSRTLARQDLKKIGVSGYLEANQVFPRMRALLEVISGTKYNGLFLIVDEIELVRKFQTRQRDQALETLRLLIDEVGKNQLPGCLMLFTGTDTFFEDDRAGIKSYVALHERISLPDSQLEVRSVRQPVIQLEGLNEERLLLMAKKVIDIHGEAYEWTASSRLPEKELIKMVQEWTSFGDEKVCRKPRPILRELVNMLDLLEENPEIKNDEVTRREEVSQNNAAEIVEILNR